MKLKINNKYEDVNFWSFLKCNFYTSLVLTLMIYFIIFILIFIVLI